MGYRWTVGGLWMLASCGPAVVPGGATEGDSADSSGTVGTDPNPTTTLGSTTVDPTTTATTNTTVDPSTTTTVDTTADSSDDSPFPDLWDGPVPDVATKDCKKVPTGAELNGYIWISNSAQGTVSKINAQTLVEEGRYLTRPDGVGNPSRTSVNRNGDVAVANRSGGVTMIRGRVDLCLDPMSTSSGPNDVLPWPDGCVEWHTPMVYASQRPVAWTAGLADPNDECSYGDIDLWTSGANASIDVLLLDGETGVIEESIPLPGIAANFYGIYGAAVDSGDHFWGSQLGVGELVRVDRATLTVDSWPMPVLGYGIAIDHNDRPWTCSSSAARFDYPTETWQTANVGGSGGCAPGNDNIMWLAASPVVGVDIDSMAVVATHMLPEYVHGISMDFDGYVWGVSIGANAYRIDPDTGTFDTVNGLVAAYTYSDMTGTALAIISGQL